MDLMREVYDNRNGIFRPPIKCAGTQEIMQDYSDRVEVLLGEFRDKEDTPGERESEGSVGRRTGGRAGTRRRKGFHPFISLLN